MIETPARPILHRVMDRAAQHLVPFQVILELTYRCNLSCKHCYIDLPAKDELSLVEYRSVLDQLKAAGTLYLLLTGGEILTRRDFFDIAGEARLRGFLLILLTNGTLVSAAAARQIAELKPVFVGLSLHGATPTTHDLVTGKRGSFAATLEAVRLLKGEDLSVALQSTLMASNVHETAAMHMLADGLRVPLRVGYDLVPTKGCSLDPQCHEVVPNDLARHLGPTWSAAMPRARASAGICKAGRGVCSISAAGDVFPCAVMPMKLGNLRRASFADIWWRQPMAELQRLRSLASSDLSACASCEIAEFCQRCVGVALAESGDITKPAPSACRHAAFNRDMFERFGRKEVLE